jgi:biotin transport system substrate-specific component
VSTVAITQERRVLADVRSASLISNIALIIGGAGLVGALAQVSIHLSFTPVPITGQTLGVMLSGAALGWRRAGLAMALYVSAGIAGMPWFAHYGSGYSGPSFGYLIGFVAAGTVLGWVASRGGDRKIARSLVAMAAGDAIIFLIGVPWLAVSYHLSASGAIADGLTPFIWGELIKSGVAGVALPASWRCVDHVTQRNS